MALYAVLAFFTLVSIASSSRDNIIMFFTDDQDMSTVKYFDYIESIFSKGPILFANTFTTTPICCPSRSIFMTGRLLHNNGAHNNSLEGNCYSLQWQKNNNERTFAYRMNKLGGYDTFYAGKFTNHYAEEATGGAAVPPGWTDFHGAGVSRQYSYNMSNNGIFTEHGDKYPGDYMPLVVRNHAVNFLDSRTADSPPFIMILGFTAPHTPADAEPHYQDAFQDVMAPRTERFNKGSNGKQWLISSKQPMDANQENFADLLYRRRLQALLTVQDVIKEIIEKVTKMGILDKTHLIYAADNGYHTGDYGMVMDKRLPYETDVRVPIMWLPSKTSLANAAVTSFKIVEEPIAIVDLAPTFCEIAGVPYDKDDFDGMSLMRFLQQETPDWRTTLLVEYRGYVGTQKPTPSCAGENLFCREVDGQFFTIPPTWDGQNFCFCEDAINNTYNCTRKTSATANQLYCEFNIYGNQPCEFYDLASDPMELNNKCESLDSATRKALSDELAALLKCSGSNCFKSASDSIHKYSTVVAFASMILLGVLRNRF